jgi:putative transposase
MADRAQLEWIARSQSLPAGLVRRAQMVLMADGVNKRRGGATLCGEPTEVTMWRTYYRERGVAGLHNELKSGRPRTMPEE